MTKAQEEIYKFKVIADEEAKKYSSLRDSADSAYDVWQAAVKAYKEAELYEKIRKKVMRDLINGVDQDE